MLAHRNIKINLSGLNISYLLVISVTLLFCEFYCMLIRCWWIFQSQGPIKSKDQTALPSVTSSHHVSRVLCSIPWLDWAFQKPCNLHWNLLIHFNSSMLKIWKLVPLSNICSRSYTKLLLWWWNILNISLTFQGREGKLWMDHTAIVN